jgi:hypothetical protein
VKTNLLTEIGPKTEPEIVKLGAELQRLMTDAITRSRKTAPEVAEEMTDRLGRPVTGSMIYELTRNGEPGREVRLPATWVDAFCQVTGDDRLQRWLAGPRLRELAELGERVCAVDSILGKMLEAVGKLKGETRQGRKRAKR